MKKLLLIPTVVLALTVVQAQVITVPTVVHVIWNTSAQNISDVQVQSLLTVINQDFSRTNPDAINTPSAFVPIASNTEIQFCLAQTDPSGNSTTGIIHKQTTVTSFNTNNNVKFTAQGGDDAWSVTQYFNIWICNLGGGLLGYAEFPTGTASNTYGAVLHYCTMPSGTCPPYNTGRTGTFEVAHCLNLLTIGASTTCVDIDLVPDTPTPYSAVYNCPSYPVLDACNPSAPGVMFMNFMAETDETCKNMFTIGQRNRMRAVLTNPPYNALATSTTCNPVGINENNYQQTVSLFPNPFCTQTTLQTDIPLHNATLTVDNCFGQTVAQIKNISGQTIVFNRDNLSSGLYFVRLTEENKTIAIDKLVITDK